MALKRSLLLASLFLTLANQPVPAHEDPGQRIPRLSRLILEDPGNPDLHLERGELHRLDGHWTDAEADYRSARNLGADTHRVAVCMASLHLDRGDPEAALDQLGRVPEPDTDMLWIQGRALRALGRCFESAGVLSRALASTCRPRPEDYLELSSVYLQQGDAFLPRALSVLDQGIDRLASPPVLILAAVDLEIREGALDRALARLDRLPEILGKAPATLARRGEILLLAGKTLEAQALFTRALARIETLPQPRRSAPATQELEARLRQQLFAGNPASGGNDR